MTKKYITDAFHNDLDNIYIETVKRGKCYILHWYKTTATIQQTFNHHFIKYYIKPLGHNSVFVVDTH